MAGGEGVQSGSESDISSMCVQPVLSLEEEDGEEEDDDDWERRRTRECAVILLAGFFSSTGGDWLMAGGSVGSLWVMSWYS